MDRSYMTDEDLHRYQGRIKSAYVTLCKEHDLGTNATLTVGRARNVLCSVFPRRRVEAFLSGFPETRRYSKDELADFVNYDIARRNGVEREVYFDELT